ncbi:MAG TPA: glycosyltransferase family 4 protein, partial [Anaerolineae bacterium]|nr:glycosyltransferase family 4 protein [Anaerolineae bacterium]
YFSKFELTHFYRTSVYDDLARDDLPANLHHYTSPFDLYRQLVAARPVVIQSVEPFSYYTQPLLWACYFAARKLNANLLTVALENRLLGIKFGKLRAALLRRVLRMYLKRACLIIVENNGAQQNVLDCGVSSNCIRRALWGTWGVDTDEFTPRAARPPDVLPTILFAGRLHPEKGVFVLMEAFARVRQRIPTARLLMAGAGAARDALGRRAQELGVSGAIHWLGSVKHREMPQVFQEADVFCAPSITTRKWAEQVGVASLQAMACGVPVVSTHSGAIPEYIPDGIAGLLVEEQNANALADALIQLLTNRELAHQMGTRGREYACAHYDARRNVQLCEQLVMEHCLARGI